VEPHPPCRPRQAARTSAPVQPTPSGPRRRHCSAPTGPLRAARPQTPAQSLPAHDQTAPRISPRLGILITSSSPSPPPPWLQSRRWRRRWSWRC
jgi:hypothetical protein